LSLLLGGALGVALGAMRELRDRTYRTEEQVRELGLEFLGMLQSVTKTKNKKPWLREHNSGKQESGTARVLRPHASNVMRHTLDHPLSNFAEVFRAIKISADLTLAGRTPKIVGIISVLPGEGKSTVAKNLGSLLAHQGARTLLIDADLRNPGLTRAVAPEAEVGLAQAVLEDKPIKDLLYHEEESKLDVLPAVLQRRLPHVSEFLASAGMKSVLKQAEQDYEWIVLDLPPLGPVVDVRAIVRQIDAFVLVVEWGKTTRRLVRATLGADRQIHAKCLGVLFNKVNMKKLKLYEADGSKAYYSGQFSNYYREGT